MASWRRARRRHDRLKPRPRALAWVAGAVGLLNALTAQAQRQAPTPQNTTVNVNYVYAASLGFGGYSIGGLSANVYTLPLADTLADRPRDGWAIKLLLPVQLGLYDFSNSVGQQHLSIHQQSVSVVPGAELRIPLADRLVVKPFAQVGAGYTFSAGDNNPGAWIYLAGVRSVAQWPAGDYTLSLGSGVVFAGDKPVGSGFDEHYVALQLAAEIRRPLGFKLGHLAPDLGIFAADYYYPSPLQFSRFLENPLRVHNQNEIGFSVGSTEPFKLLWLSNPRLGAGIVFGGGLTVYHVNFGFPF